MQCRPSLLLLLSGKPTGRFKQKRFVENDPKWVAWTTKRFMFKTIVTMWIDPVFKVRLKLKVKLLHRPESAPAGLECPLTRVGLG